MHKDLAQLRADIRAIDAAAETDGVLRQRLHELRLDPAALPAPPDDPFSPAWRTWVIECQEAIRGETYRTGDEGLNIDIGHELRWGFPYGTQDCATVGGYLKAYGAVIEAMALPPGSTILEMGSGTGALTRHLMGMGHRVVAVDINASNAALVGALGAHAPHPPQTVQASFEAFTWPAESADAVIFFESLHHSLDHVELLRRARGWLRPGGVLVCGAEPIVEAGDAHVPWPWGVRLDGGSLRAMIRWGWMELGFQRPYFEAACEAAGLAMQRVVHSNHLEHVWTARV